MAHSVTFRVLGMSSALLLAVSVSGCGDDPAGEVVTGSGSAAVAPVEVDPIEVAEDVPAADSSDAPPPTDEPAPAEPRIDGSSGDAAPRFVYSQQQAEEAASRAGPKSAEDTVAWIESVRAGRAITLSPDHESRNVEAVANEAALADAAIRLLAAEAIVEADGDVEQGMVGVTDFLLDLDELSVGAPEEADAGRYHVARAKMAFLAALEARLREGSGGRFPEEEVNERAAPLVAILQARVSEATNVMCEGWASVVEKQWEEQQALLPPDWRSEPPADGDEFTITLRVD